MRTASTRIVLLPLAVVTLATLVATAGSALSLADPLPGPDSCDGVITYEPQHDGRTVSRCLPQEPEIPCDGVIVHQTGPHGEIIDRCVERLFAGPGGTGKT